MTGAARRKAERRGHVAETVACWWLRLKAYRIVARRVRTPRGEIDIIARRGAVTAFVEVKTRTSHDMALASVTPHQARRIMDAARIWLAQQRDQSGQDCRFDIVAVSAYLLPRHLANAFGENGHL